MTTTRLDHTNCGHDRTPAARKACRKRMSNGQSPRDDATERALDGVKPATWHVKPKAKKTPAGLSKNVKRSNSLIKNRSDLADVPHALVHGIEEAWARDLDVRVGDRFREDEARITVQADLAEIALVWKVTNPHGVHGIFVRNWDSSRTFKVNSIAEAFTVAETRELWDELGNLRTA